MLEMVADFVSRMRPGTSNVKDRYSVCVEKDWQARFELGRSRSYPPWTIWLFFALTSGLILKVIGTMLLWMLFTIHPAWLRILVGVCMTGGAIAGAYRIGKREMLKFCGKFFLLGTVVGVVCGLLSEFVLPQVWIIPLLLLWPGAFLILGVEGTPSPIWIPLSLSALPNGICYAVLGGFLFVNCRNRRKRRAGALANA